MVIIPFKKFIIYNLDYSLNNFSMVNISKSEKKQLLSGIQVIYNKYTSLVPNNIHIISVHKQKNNSF